MDEDFEAALLHMDVGDMSGVVITDSGCHLIVRTKVDRPAPRWPPAAGQPQAAAAPPVAVTLEPAVEKDTTEYRTLHILVKHKDSARLASWRDPNGDNSIKVRCKPAAPRRPGLSSSCLRRPVPGWPRLLSSLRSKCRCIAGANSARGR